MDCGFNVWRTRLREGFAAGLPGLSKRLKETRIPRGFWILPGALILAIWAHRGSLEEGRLDWLRTNPPSVEAWNSLLTTRKFVAVEEPGWREKANGEMPEASRAKASVWVSEDRYTLAIRLDGEWEYFALGGAKNGSGGGEVVRRDLWEPLGIGWEGVAAFTRLELPLIRIHASQAPESREWRDPRGLHY